LIDCYLLLLQTDMGSLVKKQTIKYCHHLCCVILVPLYETPTTKLITRNGGNACQKVEKLELINRQVN